ncbi:uncharacterized protein isoform X2 [Rhodnius prolixus]
MDHSIFGNLMDINGAFKEDSHYSQEEEYVDDQTSNTQVPEGTVGHGYDSGFHPHPDYIDVATLRNDVVTKSRITRTSVKKNSKRRGKKKLTVKGKEIRFFCTQCDYRTWKKSNFQRHLGTHNKKKLDKCNLCSYSSKNAEDLKKHTAYHLKKETMQLFDDKRFATLKDEVTIEPRWTYSVVNNNNKEVKREIKEEAELFPPVEVYLDEQSNNLCVPDSSLDEDYESDFYPLAVNIEIATPQNSVKPIRQFNNTQVSVNNELEVILQNDQQLRYNCPYCSYRTWKTSNFQRHLCTHTDERPHKCPLCKYSGKHHEDLKKHMLCHNRGGTTIEPKIETPSDNLDISLDDDEETSLDSDKRFSCPLCDFKTTRSSMLYRHQRVVHNDHRPFACNLCPYRSKQRDSLKKHMMAHTDERPFECEVCHHRCRQKGDLKRHKLLHSGERPFACPHCPYRSNRTQLLKKHISRRHIFQQTTADFPASKTTLYEEFTGGHYLAEMF